ncbi:MAG: class I SAM-dependent methyltransferase [Promethearchaeota archaeon]
MKKRRSNFSYRLLSLAMNLRSRSRKPMETLKQLGVKKGQIILDYGAGPGVYSIPAAQLVETSGKVYSADIHPMAKKIVEKKAHKFKLTNIETLLVNVNTRLEDQAVDSILLFDVLHQISEKSRLMKEFHRILKIAGKLFILPDHLSNEEVKQFIKSDGLFIFKQNHNKILEFQKIG